MEIRNVLLNLPRFCRHLRSHESAVGVCHGQTEAASVHEGVQGAGRSHRAGERESHRRGGAGTRSDGDGAAELGAAGGDRCRPGGAGRAHDRGAGGTRAAAAREPDAADGAGHPKKSNGLLREGESVRFRFIAAEKAVFPVRVLCRTLKVSRAGFYAWQARPSAPRARADERLGLEIAAIHAETRQRYGSPRIHAELGERGCRTGRKRVARLMRVRGLAARRRRLVSGHDAVATSVSHRPQRPGAAIRAYWAGPGVGHRHHLHSDGRGLAYLAVILDLCSRFAVGWAMNERITDDLTLDALGMALARRRPPRGLLHHSDRGSQYASGDYQRMLAQHGIVCSMSRRGDCWDNAVAGSFFATLKVELVHDAAWSTRAAARSELFDYLEPFYNGRRRHSALGYLSPRAFEQQREYEALAT